MISYILIFLIFGFAGWIIDTIYTSFEKKRFIVSGYFKNIPLCPIYGIGGLIITSIFIQFKDLSALDVITLTSVLVITLEYVGGWFSHKVLGERLWDYSHLKFNLHGYICLLNSIYWILLVALLYFLIDPRIDLIYEKITYVQNVTQDFDILIATLFVIGYVVLTIKNWQRRMENLKK